MRNNYSILFCIQWEIYWIEIIIPFKMIFSVRTIHAVDDNLESANLNVNFFQNDEKLKKILLP